MAIQVERRKMDCMGFGIKSIRIWWWLEGRVVGGMGRKMSFPGWTPSPLVVRFKKWEAMGKVKVCLGVREDAELEAMLLTSLSGEVTQAVSLTVLCVIQGRSLGWVIEWRWRLRSRAQATTVVKCIMKGEEDLGWNFEECHQLTSERKRVIAKCRANRTLGIARKGGWFITTWEKFMEGSDN